MGFQIEDGKGSGRRVAIDSNNRIETAAIVESQISEESGSGGRAYAWVSVTYSYAANDTVLLVKNLSSVDDLVIERINLTTDTTTICHVHLVECPIPTGTDVTGVNLNRSSANVANANAKSNETTNVRSISGIIDTISLEANRDHRLGFSGSVILGTNDCIAVDFVTAGTAGTVTLTGYYHLRG